MWICPVCGTENIDNAVYCRECGANRDSIPETKPQQYRQWYEDHQNETDYGNQQCSSSDSYDGDWSNQKSADEKHQSRHRENYHPIYNYTIGHVIALAACWAVTIAVILSLRKEIFGSSPTSKWKTSPASSVSAMVAESEQNEGAEDQSANTGVSVHEENSSAEEEASESTMEEIAGGSGTKDVTDGAALNTKTEHRYEAYIEDVTWPEAFERAREKGGRLAIIRNENEWNKVCAALDRAGNPKVNYYIGASRDASGDHGPYYWVYDVEITGPGSYEYRYFKDSDVTQQASLSGHWLSGEPSYQDTVSLSSGGTATVPECCLTILRPAGGTGWWLNDASDYLLDSYPSGYDFHGKIGYVVEYDQ